MLYFARGPAFATAFISVSRERKSPSWNARVARRWSRNSLARRRWISRPIDEWIACINYTRLRTPADERARPFVTRSMMRLTITRRWCNRARVSVTSSSFWRYLRANAITTMQWTVRFFGRARFFYFIPLAEVHLRQFVCINHVALETDLLNCFALDTSLHIYSSPTLFSTNIYIIYTFNLSILKFSSHWLYELRCPCVFDDSIRNNW